MQMQMSFDFPFTKDYKTFYMKQKYRADTYQAGFVFQCTAFRPDFRPGEVMKHMKISASLDKGTPNMALASIFYVISSLPSLSAFL